MFPIPVQPDKGFEVLCKGEEIESLDPCHAHSTGAREPIEILEQGRQAASQVDQSLRRRERECLDQRGIEALARGVDDHDVRVAESLETVAGRAAQDPRAGPLVGWAPGQSELEPAQGIGAALVEPDLARMGEQAEADRADAAIVFGDARLGRHECRDPIDGAFEERKMALAERSRREEDVHTPNRFPDGVLPRQMHRPRAEDRIRALGLRVEEESLESLAESLDEHFGQRAERLLRRAIADEHDLDSFAASLDQDLHIAKAAAMGTIGVGLDAGFADGQLELAHGLVDARMVDGAIRGVDDAMTVGLEEPDLGTARAAANREASAMAMTSTGRLVNTGLGETGGFGQAHERLPGSLGKLDLAEAWATGAGWAMGTIVAGRHAPTLPRPIPIHRDRRPRDSPVAIACGGEGRAAVEARAREGDCYRAPMRATKKSGSKPSIGRDAFLATTPEDVAARGWDRVDVLFVTGDAYVDHPSFAMAILGRWLEAHGFRVAILSQPDWRSAQAFRAFAPPRLFCAVSAGNMDSMINHYTANKKRRNADAYSPGGKIGARPDRPTAVYAQRCREAFKSVPVISGGVEASLRRIAHYDYWSDRVWPSNLVTSKADLLGYGMGEATLLEIAHRLDAGGGLESLRNLRGVAYLLGKNETLPAYSANAAHPEDERVAESETIELPSFEVVREDARAFAEMTRRLHHETNPRNARRLVQRHGDRLLVINPPSLALDEATMDRLHELPYTRRPHPDYSEAPPAWETIKDSVQIMRGCFGGCTFCSITMHQGREIQSRSPDSILREVEAMAAAPDFKGSISDLGGPTANMYRMRCTKPEVESVCRRLSCVHPKICKLLDTDHAPTLDLMRRARQVEGVKRVHIASGIRMDLAADEPEYLEELAAHHVGGHLKVAPEHVSERVLDMMKKPPSGSFEIFAERFEAASKRAGKEQYLVPYFISSHPGSGEKEMIELAVFLKERGYRPRQVQDFIPAPMDVATCMYWTGLDPMTMKPVETAKRIQDRNVQRALLQFFAPENWSTVRDALRRAGREDLIGEGPDCLISARPPRPGRERPDGKAGAGGYRRPSRDRGQGRGNDGGGKGSGRRGSARRGSTD